MSDELVTEFNYDLVEKFKYALKGEEAEASFITLQAPSSKNMKECSFLKQAFFRSLPKEKEEISSVLKDEAKDKKITGDEIMMLIVMSENVDLINVLITARELFASGVALVDGETKVTKPILDSIKQDDLEAMVGAYMANFILASSIARMENL